MEDVNELKQKSVISLVMYFVGFFLGSSLLLILLIKFFDWNYDYSYSEINEALMGLVEDQRLNKVAAIINVLSNLIIYIVLAVLIGYTLHKFLIIDFYKIKENQRRFLLTILLGSIGFYLIVFLIDNIIAHFVSGSSANQELIESVFNYKSLGIAMTFITVFLGPFVEELIFRKAIFSFFTKNNPIIPIIVSSLCFALPHMLSTSSGVLEWFLLFIPYLLSGMLLGTIYHFSNKNIYVTIVIHMFNNLIACLILFF